MRTPPVIAASLLLGLLSAAPAQASAAEAPPAAASAAAGTARPAAPRWTLPAGAEVTGLRPGVEPGQERHRDVPACRDFRLTAAQALAFFRLARVIDRQVEVHEFNWAPCLMTGRLRWPGGTADWKVSAFLVGEVRPATGEVVLLGCDGACEAAVHAAGLRPR